MADAKATEKTRAAKRSKDELFIERGQNAVAKIKAAYLELQSLASKGGYSAAQVDAIFSHIEEKLQVPSEQAFKAALAGKPVESDGFSLAPVATPAT